MLMLIADSLGYSHVMSVLYRVAYILVTYTGVRAAFNRARHAFLPRLQAAVIEGHGLRVNHTALMIRVHSRVLPRGLPPDRRAGLISIRLASPGIPRPLYALLCATSHFGCGHLEIVFYEEQGRIVFHGIRNILKSNADRIGRNVLSREDWLSDCVDEIVILEEVSRLLKCHGLEVSLAAPADCVTFSVNKHLLHPEKRDATLETLRRQYVRLWKKVALRDNRVHVLPALGGSAVETAPVVGVRRSRPRSRTPGQESLGLEHP
jgi:hypothetical protein